MFDEALTINLHNSMTSSGLGTGIMSVRDDALVQAVLAGNDEAFGELFERHKLTVTRVVARFFRERSDIEEFVQQSFTNIYFALPKYRGGEENSFPAWITRIAVNVCYDHFRKRGRRPESNFTDMATEETDYLETVVDPRSISAERQLAAADLVERVLGCLEEKDRIAMTLVYSGDYSLGEVAYFIGISETNLKSRLFRCRNRIREKFAHLFE